jgi:hypothetical protein
MSTSVPFSFWNLPAIREILRDIESARANKNWAVADEDRDYLLSLDTGVRITQSRDGKISMFHWPSPPFEKQFHYCNYGEFIANSRE